MAMILAAHFASLDSATHALERLQALGFRRSEIAEFHLNAAGQNDRPAAAEAGTADPSAVDASKGALTGAVAGAAAAGVVGGVAAAALIPGFVVLLAVGSAAAGAYVGSLIGAVHELPSDDSKIREAGVTVAVRIDDASRAGDASRVLEQSGGTRIERAEGVIRDGEWVDFDPRRPPAPRAP